MDRDELRKRTKHFAAYHPPRGRVARARRRSHRRQLLFGRFLGNKYTARPSASSRKPSRLSGLIQECGELLAIFAKTAKSVRRRS